MAAPYAWLDALVDNGWIRKDQLSPAALRLLLALGRHMNAQTAEAFPGIERLESLTGLARASLFAALGELRDAGLVDVTTRTKPGKYRDYQISVYSLRPVPPLPAGYESRNLDSARQSSFQQPTVQTPVAIELNKELSTLTDQLGTGQFRSPVRESDGEQSKGFEQSKKLDTDLRGLVIRWVRDNPGTESVEQKALLCSRWLQATGRLVPTNAVLELLRNGGVHST